MHDPRFFTTLAYFLLGTQDDEGYIEFVDPALASARSACRQLDHAYYRLQNRSGFEVKARPFMKSRIHDSPSPEKRTPILCIGDAGRLTGLTTSPALSKKAQMHAWREERAYVHAAVPFWGVRGGEVAVHFGRCRSKPQAELSRTSRRKRPGEPRKEKRPGNGVIVFEILLVHRTDSHVLQWGGKEEKTLPLRRTRVSRRANGVARRIR
nr:hypothetical protein CFP56_00977 [Quercus suber]